MIIKVARSKKKLTNFDEELIALNKEEAVALLLLPRLLGSVCRKRKQDTRLTFGCSVSTVEQSFILVVKVVIIIYF